MFDRGIVCYFGNLIILNSIAYYNVLCLIRLIDEPSFTLEQLKILFNECVPLSAHFQATCGLEKVHQFVLDIQASFDSMESKDDFKEVLEMLGIYTTIIHGWCEHYFPWYVGELFPQRTKEDVQEMARMWGL